VEMKRFDQGRRTLLQYASWGLSLAALGLPAIAGALPTAAARTPADIDALLSSMKAIGQEYLARYPGENSRRALLGLLEAQIGPLPDRGLQGFSWDALKASIKSDFEADNVVFLNGWTFARTEARLYALAVV
jgi:hypothetical protein